MNSKAVRPRSSYGFNKFYDDKDDMGLLELFFWAAVERVANESVDVRLRDLAFYLVNLEVPHDLRGCRCGP